MAENKQNNVIRPALMSDRCVIPNYANKNKQSPEQRIPRDGNGYAARFRRVAVARVLPDGNQTMTAIMRMLATVLVLWPAGAFAQAEYLTLKSWTACPTIQNTNEMLVFDGYSADCEPIRAGSRMIVEQAEQAPATRWMCIDHPAAHGTFTLCNWHTFQDEPKTWLCARFPNTAERCKWGPAENFTSEAILAGKP